MTEETKNVILVIDALPPITKDVVEKALEEMQNLLEKYCNAKCVSKVLDKTNNEFEG